jgi:hypothetical protein
MGKMILWVNRCELLFGAGNFCAKLIYSIIAISRKSVKTASSAYFDTKKANPKMDK